MLSISGMTDEMRKFFKGKTLLYAGHQKGITDLINHYPMARK